MASPNFREWLRSFATSWLSGDLSAPWTDIVHGNSADLYEQSLAIAHRMGWMLDSESPDDVLPLLAQERGLPRYIHETAADHRERIHNAWDLYSRAGTEAVILEQIEAAGYPGARIYTAANWPTRNPDGGWSQFWVYFPIGSHQITSPGPLVGSFTVGDGTYVGPIGITSAEIKELRAIIRKWKPSRWVCPEMIFQISGWAVGDGSIVGESGLEIGGTYAVIKV